MGKRFILPQKGSKDGLLLIFEAELSTIGWPVAGPGKAGRHGFCDSSSQRFR
jgi:hypothetical protein